jgi:hypothetical protein
MEEPAPVQPSPASAPPKAEEEDIPEAPTTLVQDAKTPQGRK